MSIFDWLHIYPDKKHNRLSAVKVSSPLDEKRAVAKLRRRQLLKAGKTWDATVYKLLARLARAKWNEPAYLGVLPVFSTRIRRTDQPGKIRWWVEHDIPPYDRYLCAAYYVELEVGDHDELILSVRSGQKVVLLENPTAVTFEQALAEIIQSPPVIIPRQMGAAWD